MSSAGKLWLLAPLSMVVACGSGGASGGGSGGGRPPGSGQSVSFSLPTDEGALVTVPVPGARATVLDFFGPTCEPCKRSVPELLSKQEELGAKGAKVVLVAVLGDGESTADAKKALASWGVSAPFLVDRDGTGKREAGVTTLPATIVLDGSGSVTWVAPPKATAETVVAAIK